MSARESADVRASRGTVEPTGVTDIPSCADIEALANEAERLDHPDPLPNPDDRLVVKTISGTLGWVLGWSDQPALPEEHQDEDRPDA